MSAIKTFFSKSHRTLQDEVQSWLRNTETAIHSISMDSNDYGHCLVVLHEPGGSKRYDAQIFYSTRHDTLESEANQGLFAATRPGGQQLVAVGSNNYGHCLCVIREV